MLKNLIIWLSVTLSLTTNLVLSNVQILNNRSATRFQPKTSKVVNKSFIVGDFNQVNNQAATSSYATSRDIHINGSHKDTHFRVFIDSGNDKWLPPSPIGKTNDYLIGKGKKETWYNHIIPGITIDITKYAENKDTFLKKYRAITFSYGYNYNFWNSKKGWSYKEGKNSPLMTAVKTHEISPTNVDRTIFEERDANHANNESAKLVLKQEWAGNNLKYDFYLSVSYHWKAGSTINHASIASFTADLYSFIWIPDQDNEKATKIQHFAVRSKFTFDYYASVNLIDFDKELLSRATQTGIWGANFKTVCLFAYSYYGFQKIEGTTYIYSIMARSLGVSAKDTSLILNGIPSPRTLTQIYKKDKVYFSYLNSLDKKEDSDPQDISSAYFGIQLQGFIYAPFIYTL